MLAVAAIIWGALMAIAQRDMKLLVAYSSVSHMGFIVLGIFAFNVQGQQGAVLQMVNHGIIVPALFLHRGVDRRPHRDARPLGDGRAWRARMPVMAGVFIVVVLAALGLPGLNSFVGEFMTLLGAWQRAPALARVRRRSGSCWRRSTCSGCSRARCRASPPDQRPKSDIYTGQLAPARAAGPADVRDRALPERAHAA